ncbi:MAG TPA: ABC transporter permease [Pyrinomonadaceae bacterium]|jgi:ABC-2 type transport system permease protein
MNKFLAVVKREYVQRVRSRMFVVATVLGPVMLLLFTVVPALIASIKTGGPTRIAVVDESGKLYERVRQSILHGREEEGEAEPATVAANTANESQQQRIERAGSAIQQSFDVQQVKTDGGSLEDLRRQLDERVRRDELDGYLILPRNILEGGEAEYHARNTGDVFTRGHVKQRLTYAVRDQRMAERNIQPSIMRDINSPVRMKTTKAGEGGGREDSGQGFYLVFAVGFIIYLTILMYGQVILAAVIEEKETRIAEILFSSVRAFPLMMGKLIGVSLVALTQFAIWGVVFAVFALYGVGMLAAQGMSVSIPQIPLPLVVYFFLFFLLGYFIYSTVYALVGSMVTTAQEGGQIALPIIFLLVIAFYLAFPVIRSPNSSFAFWVSMFPFFSPITMLVRIVTQTPPFWQIALSLALGFGTVVLLMWLAGRIYRTGMLMYGKRASIPEVLRWIRQA